MILDHAKISRKDTLMDAIDSLFFSCFAVAMVLMAVYFTSTITLALRNQPGSWTTFSQMSILFGHVSGRAVLILAFITLVFAWFFDAIGLPRTAVAIAVSAILFTVGHIACFLTRVKLSSMQLSSELN